MVVVQGPGLDVVLGQLGVRQQAHGVGHDLHIGVGKLLQAQVHLADLAKDTCGERFTYGKGHTPEYQRGNSGLGMCNETSYHVFGSL